MLDVAALPIAFALTLWDAAPIFLTVGVALALVFRVIAGSSTFRRFWHVREAVALEGVVYALVFHLVLAPVIAIASAVLIVIMLKTASAEVAAPASPGRALRSRAEESLWSVLIASAAGAIVKVAAPDLPDSVALYYALAFVAGAVVGFRGGAVAIPAVAFAIHLGGTLPALLCIVAAAAMHGIAAYRAGRPAALTAESS